MEQRYRIMDASVLLEEYRRLLPEAETLPLIISGNSMSPFLIHRRDTVHLAAVGNRKLKKGDMVLYQRDNGQYVLHRICRVRKDTFDLIGDAQTETEKGIRRKQIFAVVKRAERKGKTQEKGKLLWEFFEKIWIRIIPLRPLCRKGYGVLHRLRKK